MLCYQLIKIRITSILCWLVLFNIAHAQSVHDAEVEIKKLSFIQNKGQWDNPALFMANIPGGVLYTEKNVFHYIFQNQEDIAQAFKHPRKFDDDFKSFTIRNHAVRVEFVGSSEDVVVNGEDQMIAYSNYFLGDNPKYWKSNVPAFTKIAYQNIYTNIDAKLYATTSGGLKYDMVINPGGNVNAVQLNYRGADKIFLKDGFLHISTSVNSWIEQKPYAYQLINGVEQQVECNYSLIGNIVGFYVGNYNKNYSLIIDPQLIFSTYSGSSVDNFGHSATYDNDGHLYAAGIATSPTLFPNGKYPVTPGAFQQVWGGGVGQWPQAGFPCDISISKYTPDGTQLVFATYLGGSRNDYPHSLVADKNDNLVVFGTTLSSNFPTKAGCYDITYNDSFDIFVTKISADGTQLLASTYIGGSSADGINTADSLRMNYSDEFRGEVVIDRYNDIIIASSTLSSDFPTTSTAYQNTKNGKQDGCIFKLDSSLKVLKSSTYFGQSNNDAIYSIDVDSNDNVFFSGGTQSTNFTISSNTQLGNFAGGYCDGFVARINSDFSAVSNFRYWGSANYDQAYFVKLDPNGYPVIFGQHFDSVPIINASYVNPNSSLFIAKFKPSLDSVVFSTSIGNQQKNNALAPSAFSVDECGVIYGSVWGGNTNLYGNFISKHSSQVVTNTDNLSVTYDALKDTTDGSDFYLFVLERNLDSLLYGTFFGDDGDADHVDGGTSRFDKKGIVYQSVCASCSKGTSGAFLTTPNSFSPTNKSPRCSNASFKIDFRKSNIVYAEFDYSPKKFCLDSYIVVHYTNQSYNSKYHKWYVNGVLKDTAFNFVDTISAVGTYTIKLFEIDSSRCVIIDSAITSYTVSSFAKASFTTVRDSCAASYTFTSTSVPNTAPIKWYFGGGDTSSAHIASRTFPNNGLYQILLITNAGSACADSAVQNLYYDSIGYLVRASFQPLDTGGCEPQGFSFYNSSNKFSNLRWYVNDTLASTSFVLDTFFYKGLYTVKLVSTDSATCNIIDSSTHHIKIVPYAYPDFTYTQDSCSFAIRFTNTTLLVPGDSIQYHWNFGNGKTSTAMDTTITFDTAGIYIVSLIANPSLACDETTSKNVLVNNLPGILNAFFVPQPKESCTPAIIYLNNFSANQQRQEWYYNNILRDTAFSITDTFNTDTTINIKLIVYSNLACTPIDSFDTTVFVHTNTHSSFIAQRDSCSDKVIFTNHSISDDGQPLVYTWYFGDGDSSNLQSPTHSYAIDSTYTVLLITNPGTFCADSSNQTIVYSATSHLLHASFTLNDSVFCSPAVISCRSTSLNAARVEWYLNNVLIGTDTVLNDSIKIPGNYKLTFIAYNNNACAKVDSAYQTIQVGNSGIADFIIARDSCSLLVTFVNESVSALPISYTWYFGDGDSSIEKNPQHQYAASNNYTITLITNEGSPCADTALKIFYIDGDTTQEIIIPNVFTPNSDGLNDCYRIKGVTAKCDIYKVSIYNRWGELYYQSADPTACWNGQNAQGQNASDGVYYYIMDIEKQGVPKVTKHGTITLIRE